MAKRKWPYVTIPIKVETRARLHAAKRGKESLDDVIRRLLAEAGQ